MIPLCHSFVKYGNFCDKFTLANGYNFDIIIRKKLSKVGEIMGERADMRIRRILRHNLVAFRTKNNLTQQEVAQALGLGNFSTYRSWETGRSLPSHYRLLQLAEQYKIGIEEFYKEYLPAIPETPLHVEAPMHYEENNTAAANHADELPAQPCGDRYLSELSREERLLIMQYRLLNQAERKRLNQHLDVILTEHL